jgi:hypothetical protein
VGLFYTARDWKTAEGMNCGGHDIGKPVLRRHGTEILGIDLATVWGHTVLLL